MSLYTKRSNKNTHKYTYRKCWNLKKKPTCYRKKDLIEIALNWNRDNPMGKQISVNNKSKKKLWESIRSEMGDDEKKWGDISIVRKRFAPTVPHEWNINDHTWLDNFTLDKIMRYFKKKYKGFHFENATSIDFERKDLHGNCTVSELCKYKMINLVNKYSSFGTILNTEPSFMSGRHWNALYVDIKKRRIYFYDSFGVAPFKEVMTFMDRLKREGDEIHGSGSWNIKSNTFSHQKSTSECGMFSVYFIIRMLVGESFESFIRRNVTDEYVNCLRGALLDDVKGTYENRCNITLEEILTV